MSDAINLMLLSTSLANIEREARLTRLQLDNLVSRVTSQDARLGALEQSFHELVAEAARGFGQTQQQHVRTERRFDAVDTGLAGLRDSNAQIEKLLSDVLVAVQPRG